MNEYLILTKIPRDGHHTHYAYHVGTQKLVVGFKTKTGTSFYSYGNVSAEDMDQLMAQPLDGFGKYVNAKFVRNKVQHPFKNLTDRVENADGEIQISAEWLAE